MKTARVTMRQVAQRAGCSVSAVSKVLNHARGSAKVGPALARRVEQAARALGYEANAAARRLSRGRADTVGVISLTRTQPRDWLWMAWVNGVEAALCEAGQGLLLIRPRADKPMAVHLESLYRACQVDAVIGYWPAIASEAEMLWQLEVPLVVLGSREAVGFPSVTEDCEPGLRAAAAHLAGLGHREVLFTELADAAGRLAVPERRECFERHAAASGLATHGFRLVRPGRGGRPSMIEAASEQFGAWLDGGPEAPFTAALAYNDLTAIGMMHALRERGRRVPEDVSVVGYDHLYDHLAIPRLDTIDSNLFEMGRQAAGLAMEVSRDGSRYEGMRGRVVRVGSAYVRGGSCGRARRGRGEGGG
jgi:DNA-binding LacI/PurR family transcriptional regulator